MNGILSINIKGEDYRLRFNNYARAELRKFFLPKDKTQLSEQELTQEIVNKWQENEALLLKNIVYAGIVGESLIKSNQPKLTLDEVGEYVGEVDEQELFNVWREFLDASGVNLQSDKDADEKSNGRADVKKKPTKKT